MSSLLQLTDNKIVPPSLCNMVLKCREYEFLSFIFLPFFFLFSSLPENAMEGICHLTFAL